MKTRWRVLFGLALLLSIGASFAPACGGDAELAEGATSIFLTVNNQPGAAAPQVVVIEIYDQRTSALLKSEAKWVTAPMGDVLGDITIYAGAAAGELRLVGWGRSAEQTVSTGETRVTPEPNRQVRATIVLTPIVPGSDAGPMVVDGGVPRPEADAPVLPTGGAGGGGGAGGVGSGGSGGTAGMDAGTDSSIAGMGGGVGMDAGTAGAGGTPPPMKETGESCGGNAECKSGLCRDQVCCNMNCSGACYTCKAAGEPVGMCEPLPQGTTCGDAQCIMGGMRLRRLTCNASGTCETDLATCAGRNCNADTLMCN